MVGQLVTMASVEIKRKYQFIARPWRIPQSHSLNLKFPFKGWRHESAQIVRRFAVRLERDGTDNLALSILETAIEALPGLVAEKVEAAAIEAEARAFADYKWLTATTTEITERRISDKRRKVAA
jgi:hypothetical protein